MFSSDLLHQSTHPDIVRNVVLDELVKRMVNYGRDAVDVEEEVSILAQ